MMPTYSLKEISEHSNKDSLWLLIENNVYDVTKFADEHPGGPEILVDWAGKEATEAFEDIGHSSDAREQMKQYKIGELIEAERKETKVPPRSSGFRMQYLLLPLGVAVSSVLLYKLYTRIHK